MAIIFKLEQTLVALEYAIEAADLLIQTDVDDPTKMHGSLYAIKTVLEKAFQQVGSLPSDVLNTFHEIQDL